MHEYRASENKSRSDNLVVIRIQSNVSETRAADETCQGLQLMLKEKKGREKEAVWGGRYQSPWLILGLT